MRANFAAAAHMPTVSPAGSLSMKFHMIEVSSPQYLAKGRGSEPSPLVETGFPLIFESLARTGYGL